MGIGQGTMRFRVETGRVRRGQVEERSCVLSPFAEGTEAGRSTCSVRLSRLPLKQDFLRASRQKVGSLTQLIQGAPSKLVPFAHVGPYFSKRFLFMYLPHYFYTYPTTSSGSSFHVPTTLFA